MMFVVAGIAFCLLSMLDGTLATVDSVMVVSGRTSTEELCLVGVQGATFVDECKTSVASGDGRELWKFANGGKLTHVVSNSCLVGQPENRAVALAERGSGNDWETTQTGQLRLKGTQLCLSQKDGHLYGTHIAVQASSSVDTVSHGANRAIDGDAATYWVAKFTNGDPLVFTVDLGLATFLSMLDLQWEFPPLSFSVALSLDGAHYVTAFRTDVNMLTRNKIPLGAESRYVRVTMIEVHPMHGIRGHQRLTGIRSFALHGSKTQLTLDDCSSVGASVDARDKYFVTRVGQFNVEPATSLQQDLATLAATETTLSQTMVTLVSKFLQQNTTVELPKLALGGATNKFTDSFPMLQNAVDLHSMARALILGVRQAIL